MPARQATVSSTEFVEQNPDGLRWSLHKLPDTNIIVICTVHSVMIPVIMLTSTAHGGNLGMMKEMS